MAKRLGKVLNSSSGRALVQNVVGNLKRWVNNYPITFAIIAVCIIVWVLELVFGQRFVIAGVYSPLLAGHQPWRFVTSIFLHDTKAPFHIFFNMFALSQCGPLFEKMLGWKKYLTIYLVCGIFGNIFLHAWCLIFTDYLIIAFGASGAVFGLFGGLIILYKKIGARANGILITVGLNLLISFWITGIAWQAHVGGLIAGIILTFIFTYKKPLRVFWG